VGEEFHGYLIKQAGNARLLEVLEQIREHIRSVWTLSMWPTRAVCARPSSVSWTEQH
jgi:DNA-binding GntR family transcriptional regulator